MFNITKDIKFQLGVSSFKLRQTNEKTQDLTTKVLSFKPGETNEAIQFSDSKPLTILANFSLKEIANSRLSTAEEIFVQNKNYVLGYLKFTKTPKLKE